MKPKRRDKITPLVPIPNSGPERPARGAQSRPEAAGHVKTADPLSQESGKRYIRRRNDAAARSSRDQTARIATASTERPGRQSDLTGRQERLYHPRGRELFGQPCAGEPIRGNTKLKNASVERK